jgi:tetratricopeptide (TPR) repeat protein
VRTLVAIAVLGFGFGCKSAPTTSATPTKPDASVALALDAAKEVDASVASLPPVDSGPPAPIRVVGYPQPFDGGQGTPYNAFGYARDGATFIHCTLDSCCVADSTCSIRDPSGAWRSLSVVKRDMSRDQKAAREINALVADEKLLKVGEARPSGLVGPPLVGVWPYARDLTIHVVAVAGRPSESESGKTVVPVVRIGGAVAKEAPVFVATVSVDACDRPGQWACTEVGISGMALSRDGAELTVLAYSSAGVHTGFSTSEHLATATLAAGIYNDTGFRHHKAGRYEEARRLFLNAVAADPNHPFAAYNLACASARVGSPLAEAALRVAIERAKEPERVRARAASDEDFAAVRREAWFLALVAAR